VTNELLTSAAAERNKDPILTVLESILPERGDVLEIASGTGQHVCFFAEQLPHLRWQPTEPDADHLEVIATRVRESQLANIDPPLSLDVQEPHWPLTASYDVILCINMIHISPWLATLKLFAGAARHLQANGKLVLYGPYLEHGTAAQSNLDFDSSLKQRNAAWGLRDLEEVSAAARVHGLRREQIVRMPANNLTVVFARGA